MDTLNRKTAGHDPAAQISKLMRSRSDEPKDQLCVIGAI